VKGQKDKKDLVYELARLFRGEKIKPKPKPYPNTNWQ